MKCTECIVEREYMSSINRDTLAIVDAMLGGDTEVSTIREIINEMFLESVKRKQEKNPYIPPHASEFKEGFKGAWQYCYRKSILQEFYFYPEEEISVSRVRINELGWYIHVMLQRLWKHSKRAKVIEIEITHKHPKYGIFYTIDVVSLFEELFGTDEVVIEIKSMNRNNFEHAITQKTPEKMHPEGYKQAQIYMFLSERKRAGLLLYNKDNSDYHLEFFEYNPLFMQPYISRIETRTKLRTIFEESNGKKIPKKLCTSSDSSRASSCPVRDICFMHSAAEREKFRRTALVQEQQNSSLIHEEIIYDDQEKH